MVTRRAYDGGSNTTGRPTSLHMDCIAAEGEGRRLGRGKRLLKNLATLFTGHVIRSGEIGDGSVAGRVHEHIAAKGPASLARERKCLHRHDRPVLAKLHLVDDGVEVELQAGVSSTTSSSSAPQVVGRTSRVSPRFSSRRSSARPDSTKNRLCAPPFAPSRFTRISVDALPPRTGRSWIRADRAPARAGADCCRDAGHPAAHDHDVVFPVLMPERPRAGRRQWMRSRSGRVKRA